jgi:hypothetical protein
MITAAYPIVPERTLTRPDGVTVTLWHVHTTDHNPSYRAKYGRVHRPVTFVKDFDAWSDSAWLARALAQALAGVLTPG